MPPRQAKKARHEDDIDVWTSVTQGVFVELYASDDGDPEDSEDELPFSLEDDAPGFPIYEHDLADGPEIRGRAFSHAWNRCRARLQDTLDRLHAPTLDRISSFVADAYSPKPFLSPYNEVPACIVIGSNSSDTALLLRAACDRIASTSAHVCCELASKDFKDLQSGMRTLIARLVEAYEAFLDGPPGGWNVPKKPGTTILANYDFEGLVAWYEHISGSREHNKLVITLSDADAFDPSLLADLIHLLSFYQPQLPFVLLLGVSTSSTALHDVLPRSTLAELEIAQVAAPHARETFDELVQALFFSADWLPDVYIGPSVFDALSDISRGTDNSSATLLSALHLLHIAHFFQPYGTLSSPPSTLPSASPAHYLLPLPSVSSALPSLPLSTQQALLSGAPTAPQLMTLVQDAHAAFRAWARRFAVAFRLLQILYDVVRENPAASNSYAVARGTLMLEGLRGTLAKRVNAVMTAFSKLSVTELSTFLSRASEYLEALPTSARHPEQAFIDDIARDVAELYAFEEAAAAAEEGETPRRPKRSPEFVRFLENVGTAWEEVLLERLKSPRHLLFHELWRIDSSRDLRLILTPAPSHTLHTALTHPHLSLPRPLPLPPSSRPDLALLFARYLEAGRTLNVADWFDAFCLALEDEKHGACTEEEREEELQARFTRGVNELDWMGYLKKTGRRRGCVGRTVFAPLAEEDGV